MPNANFDWINDILRGVKNNDDGLRLVEMEQLSIKLFHFNTAQKHCTSQERPIFISVRNQVVFTVGSGSRLNSIFSSLWGDVIARGNDRGE